MLIRFLALLLCAVAVTACSQQEQAPAAGLASAPAASAVNSGASTEGAAVYNKTCFVCHGSGAGGAPTLDAGEDWEVRVAQGLDTLYRHAIEGFTGEKGIMPAKGANLALTDGEVKAAVDYMRSQIQ